MLKHTSSRLELRHFGSFGEADGKISDNFTSPFDDTFHTTFENELQFENANEGKPFLIR